MHDNIGMDDQATTPVRDSAYPEILEAAAQLGTAKGMPACANRGTAGHLGPASTTTVEVHSPWSQKAACRMRRRFADK